MNRQEVFEKVARHLLKQGRKSVHAKDGVCQLRGDGGRACAIGCLIADEHYDPSLEEGQPWSDWVMRAVIASGVDVDLDDGGEFDALDATSDRRFLHELQRIHDGEEPEEWRDGLADFARRAGLSSTFLSEIP